MNQKHAATPSVTAIIVAVAFFSFGIGYMIRPIEVARAQSSAPQATPDGNPVGFTLQGTLSVSNSNGVPPACLTKGSTPCNVTFEFSTENTAPGCASATYCAQFGGGSNFTLTGTNAGGTPIQIAGAAGTGQITSP
ncbi:MAG TPA: hypothetical protein VKR56_15335 [Candidatus Cybelea sp.]|nr:hypothetical protein [Candidatus Cybelea sp.]